MAVKNLLCSTHHPGGDPIYFIFYNTHDTDTILRSGCVNHANDAYICLSRKNCTREFDKPQGSYILQETGEEERSN